MDIELRKDSFVAGLKRNNIRKGNIKLILEFDKENAMAELSDSTRVNYLQTIYRFTTNVDKAFDRLTKEDIEDYVKNFNPKQMKKRVFISKRKGRPAIGGYKPNTVKMHNARLLYFFKWLNGGDIYPEFSKPLRQKIRGRKARNEAKSIRLSPNQILTMEDIEEFVKTAKSIKYKALIYTLFDSGCRMQELLNLKLQDITKDDNYWLISVDGKTGERLISIPRATLWLEKWLECNPLVNLVENPFVFVSLYEFKKEKEDSKKEKKDFTRFNVSINQSTINQFLQEVKEKTIKRLKEQGKDIENLKLKPINPHAFRHARATEAMKENWSIPEMNAFFGWEHDSRMALTYSHLGNSDIKKRLDEKYGFSEKEKKLQKIKLTCPKCGKDAPLGTKFCLCGWIFSNKLIANIGKQMGKKREAFIENKGFAPLVKGLITEIEKMRSELAELKKSKSL